MDAVEAVRERNVQHAMKEHEMQVSPHMHIDWDTVQHRVAEQHTRWAGKDVADLSVGVVHTPRE